MEINDPIYTEDQKDISNTSKDIKIVGLDSFDGLSLTKYISNSIVHLQL